MTTAILSCKSCGTEVTHISADTPHSRRCGVCGSSRVRKGPHWLDDHTPAPQAAPKWYAPTPFLVHTKDGTLSDDRASALMDAWMWGRKVALWDQRVEGFVSGYITGCWIETGHTPNQPNKNYLVTLRNEQNELVAKDVFVRTA